VVQSGASDSGSTVLNGGTVVDSGYVTQEAVNAGGSVTVMSGGYGYDDQVTSGGTETVQQGGDDFSFTGVIAKQTTTDTASITPFATVGLLDTYPGGHEHGNYEDIIVKQTGPGALTGLNQISPGVYQAVGFQGAVIAALDAAEFVPAIGLPGSVATTTFTVFDFGTFSTVGTPISGSPVAEAVPVTVTTVTPPKPIPHVPPYGGQIIGTQQGDLILAQGWNNVIDGLGGNDVIDAGQGNATVYTHDGDSQVTLHGYGNTVSGGDGDQTVTGSQGNTRVTLGSGADIVSLGGFGNYIRTDVLNEGTIDAGVGNETLDIGGGSAFVTAGGWGDSFTFGDGVFDVGGFDGTASITLDWTSPHAATDSLHLRGAAGDTVTQIGNVMVVTAPSGANLATIKTGDAHIVATPDGVGGLDFTFVNGPVNAVPGVTNALAPILPTAVHVPSVDVTPPPSPQPETLQNYGQSFTATPADTSTSVTYGPGDDSVTLGNGWNSVTLGGYNDTVTVGNGENILNVGLGDSTVTVASGGTGTIVTQGYDNRIAITGSNGGVYSITPGAGQETVDLGTAAATVDLTGYANVVSGGYGPAEINLVGAGGGNRFEVTAVGGKGGMDIANFGGAGSGNVLDLSEMFPGLTSTNPSLSDYVDVYSDQGSNSFVVVAPPSFGQVLPPGSSPLLLQVAYLRGTGGADLTTLLANHQIIL